MITTKQINTKPPKGFSLVEMAIVLVILGILLGGLMTSLGQSASNARRTTTNNQLRMVQEALYGFAQANGRLPCPATAASAGREAPIGGGDCTLSHGFVPTTTLGLSGAVDANALLLDSWQNPLRYSVSTLNTGAGKAFTSAPGLQVIFASPPTLLAAAGPSSPTMLSVCDSANCAGSVTATTIPAMIISMGANWSTFTSADEVENAGGTVTGGYRITNTNNFVSRTFADDNFDDMLLWVSPNILYSRLISAQKLP